ncbi:hypothetical protein MIDIC_510021 [Alphaproteobacteria bacterium]
MIEEAKYHPLSLPPYSPDLNPIEKFFVNLKASDKILKNTLPSLIDVVDAAFKNQPISILL